eukprot:5021725-Amphidinium_carterae.1
MQHRIVTTVRAPFQDVRSSLSHDRQASGWRCCLTLEKQSCQSAVTPVELVNRSNTIVWSWSSLHCGTVGADHAAQIHATSNDGCLGD